MGLPPQSRARVGASCLSASLLGLLVAGAPAGGAPKPISGTLSKPGYTVVSLAASGQATVAQASRGRFRLRPPATRVTLHLRAPDGTYAGPIVLRRKGNAVKQAKRKIGQARRKVRRAKRSLKRAGDKRAKAKARKRLGKARKQLTKARRLLREARKQVAPNRAILGVRAGAPLGRVKVDSAAGYSVAGGLRRRAWTRWVDTRRTARARRGVPVGAGNFGHVPAVLPRRPLRGDLDLDGVPDALDIDDDGDLTLDDLDRSRPAGARARAAQQIVDFPFLSYVLSLTTGETLNVNAGSSDERIERTPLVSGLMGGILSDRSPALRIGLPQAASTELDCGTDNPTTSEREGLIYCSAGSPQSKGRLFPNGPTQPAQVFPDCCDSEVPPDGFGTLRSVGLNTGVMDLHHTATTGEIRTGQTLIKHVTNGDPRQCPGPPPACVTFLSPMQYVFATVPALVSYSDTEGNSGTVQYPFQPSPPGFVVAPRPDGHVLATVTLWQPQRRPIPPDPKTGGGDPCAKANPPCAWIDIGGLEYTATVTTGPHTAPFQTRRCPRDAYIIPPGQGDHLMVAPGGDPPPGLNPELYPARGLLHTVGDRPTNPGNRVTYTLDLTKCLAGLPWGPGQSTSVEFRASGQPPRIPQFPNADSGYAAQTNVAFIRRGARITVKKQTDPAESPTSGTEFEFQSNIPTARPDFKLRHDGSRTYEVPPGTYTVSELDHPNYNLTEVTCEGDANSTGSAPDRKATFDVELGEVVTCTFKNSPKP